MEGHAADKIQEIDITLPDGRIMTMTITKQTDGNCLVGQYTKGINDGIKSYVFIDGLTSLEIEEFSTAFRNVMKEDKKAYASYLWEELNLEFDYKRMADIVISVLKVMDDAILLSQVATPDAPYGSIYCELMSHFDDANIFYCSWADGEQRPDRFGGPWAYDKAEYYDEFEVLTLKNDSVFSSDPVLVYHIGENGRYITEFMDREYADEILMDSNAEIIEFKRSRSLGAFLKNKLFD